VAVPKALILAHSAPDRTADILNGVPARELLSVGNAPIVHQALATVRHAGIVNVAVTVHPSSGEAIRAAVGSGERWGLNVTYVECEAGARSAAALLAAESFLAGSHFVVHPGDGVLMAPLALFVESALQWKLDAVVLTGRAPRARGRRRAIVHEVTALHNGGNGNGSFGDGAGEREPAPTGVAILSDAVFPCLHDYLPVGGELELGDAIELLRAGRQRVEEREAGAWWRYDGSAESLLEGNRVVLDELSGSDLPAGVVASDVNGRVEIHATARVRSSMVRGPAMIGAGAEVVDAYVGPYTSVGERAVVEGAEIEDSVILPGGSIRFVSERLQHSVLGRNAKLFRDFGIPKAVRLVAGDGTEIALA
jgi:glucose-1-phosphate thymidylyltransferase